MLVSNKTISVLKNFYGINQGLVLRKGKKQTTISGDEDIFAESTFDEEIPVELGIFDLQRFLGNISNLTDPSIEFEKNIIKLSDKNTTILYYSCKPDLLNAPDADMDLSIENSEMSFSLVSTVLQKALKLAAINGSDRVTFERKDNKLYISVSNSKDKTANKASIFIEENEGDNKSFVFAAASINKIMDVDYNVQIEGDLASFVAKDDIVKYFISRVED